jgi:hypothetical protein
LVARIVITRENGSRPMPNTRDPRPDPRQPTIYEIRIDCHLDREWSDWFEGLAVTLAEDGTTRLIGPVADQAALHGLLKKVRDLGVPLVSINRLASSPAPQPTEVGDRDVR